MVTQENWIYKLSLLILFLTQIVTAFPARESSLLGVLWFIWIAICSFYALKICVVSKKGEILFSVLVLLFWIANVVSYIISPKHVSSWYADVDTIVILKSITIAFFSYFPFYYFSKKGVITRDNLKRFVFLLFIIFVLRIISDSFRLSSATLQEDNVLNLAYLFVQIIPLIIIAFRRRWLYVLVFLASLFVLWGAKRGAVLCLFVELLVFFVYLFKSESFGRKHKGSVAIVVLILVSVAIVFVNNDAFLHERLLTTGTEEDRSGQIRTEMYESLFNVFLNSSNGQEILFGHGMGQTVSYTGNLAHQDWLELLIDNGVLVLLLYIVIIWTSFKNISKCDKSVPDAVKYALKCCVYTWVLIATYSILYASRDSFVLFVTLGIIDGFIQKGKREQLLLRA